MSELKNKVTKSWALNDDNRFKVYKGFAIDPNDPEMFNSEAEVDAYRKEAVDN